MKNWFGKIFGVRDKSVPRAATIPVVRETKYEAEYAKPVEETVRENEPQNPNLPSGLPRGNWEPGQELLGDFVVEKTLGVGGMGEVYLVRSRSTGSRFAVKRAKVLSESSRRRFLDELQTWIDLPEHPNLVPCRFFRTVGDEILIFAEYVEGGSLEGWIDSRRLYQGGPQQALERMLDIAIQFAWGLHCLHEVGLIHQDVKPGNVLVSMEGETSLLGVRSRVTDFGLVRARAAGGEAADSGPRHSILVSTSGGTPSYWSPEQASWLKLTCGADIWSWGVSVLELFTGRVAWNSGLDAPAALEQLLWSGARDSAIPAMPGGLADLLRRCFRQEPAERLASLREAVNPLKAIYQESIGAGYNRTLKGIEREVSSQTGIKERRGASGITWTDPRVWLEKALLAAGRDPAEAAKMLEQRGVTRRGELVAEMAAYDEARWLYLCLIQEGCRELESDLARLCIDKALVHRTAADEYGAIEEYNKAIAILERLVNQEGRRELANNLATAYMNKAIAVGDLRDERSGVTLYDKAIAIWERLVNQEGRRELDNNLAWGYSSKAVALMALGDNGGAVALYDKAIAIRERLVNHEGRRELANNLANVYMGKANALKALGDNCDAVALYDKAIANLEQLVNQEGRAELANDLAMVYINKAATVSDLGNERGAVLLYDKAIAIRERLINREGRRELANNLSATYMNKAIVLKNLGDNRGAVALYDQAITIRERLVNQEGRCELANDLAMAYMNKATAVSNLGDKCGAVSLYDQTIAILERLVNQEGRRELVNDLVMAYMNKATAVSALGDNRGAVALYDQAITIRERLVNQEGRRELIGDLAWIKAGRGYTLIILGERERGLEEMRSAQRILEAEVARTGRADLKRVLAWLAYAIQYKVGSILP